MPRYIRSTTCFLHLLKKTSQNSLSCHLSCATGVLHVKLSSKPSGVCVNSSISRKTGLVLWKFVQTKTYQTKYVWKTFIYSNCTPRYLSFRCCFFPFFELVGPCAPRKPPFTVFIENVQLETPRIRSVYSFTRTAKTVTVIG